MGKYVEKCKFIYYCKCCLKYIMIFSYFVIKNNCVLEKKLWVLY